MKNITQLENDILLLELVYSGPRLDIHTLTFHSETAEVPALFRAAADYLEQHDPTVLSCDVRYHPKCENVPAHITLTLMVEM